MRRWGLADVVGESMLPLLPPGSVVVVHWAARVRLGDVVVARRPDRPGLLVIKRVTRREGDRWWIQGDNADASDDSRVFGAVPADAVVGRVVLRWKPGWPRRIGRRSS